MAKIAPLSISDVEYLSHRLAKRMFEWSEPIPDFGTRFPNKLERCLLAPFQTFSRRNLYKGLLGKVAILFYLMIKNHPFQNGNKRIAMTTLFVFLHQNEKWLQVDNQTLYNFAKWVATSDPTVKNATVRAIEDFLKKHMVNLKNDSK